MVEFRIERSEFLYMLSAIQGTQVVGIDSHELWPPDPDLRKKALADGENHLLSRGLLLIGSDGSRVLDLTLTSIVTAIARPDRAVLITLNLQRRGPQLVVLYQSDDLAVEQTFPTADTHRLVLLGDANSLIPRLRELHTTGAYERAGPQYELAQQTFFDAQRHVESGQPDTARALLITSGFALLDADSLIQALRVATVEINTALLQCRGATITDARNVALASSERATWTLRQRVAGEPTLLAEISNKAMVDGLLARLYHELAPFSPAATPTSAL